MNLVWGTVSGTSPLEVIIDGDGTSPTEIAWRFEHYGAPGIGDRVALVPLGGGYVALGSRVAS